MIITKNNGGQIMSKNVFCTICAILLLQMGSLQAQDVDTSKNLQLLRSSIDMLTDDNSVIIFDLSVKRGGQFVTSEITRVGLMTGGPLRFGTPLARPYLVLGDTPQVFPLRIDQGTTTYFTVHHSGPIRMLAVIWLNSGIVITPGVILNGVPHKVNLLGSYLFDVDLNSLFWKPQTTQEEWLKASIVDIAPDFIYLRSTSSDSTQRQLIRFEGSVKFGRLVGISDDIHLMSDPRPIDEVIADLKFPEYRGGAVFELGKRKDVRALEPIIKCMNDSVSHVRKTAVDALLAIGDKKAIEPLRNASINDPDKKIRAAAKKALKKLERLTR
jgi:hypothetical protein